MLKNVAFNCIRGWKISSFRRYFSTTPIIQTEKLKVVGKEAKIDVKAYFKEIDLRVGRIVHVEEMKDSENIFCCKVDIGEKSFRDIGTGIKKYVKKEEIENSQVIVFTNLKPRKLGGKIINYYQAFISNGMILCAGNENDLEVLRPPSGSYLI